MCLLLTFLCLRPQWLILKSPRKRNWKVVRPVNTHRQRWLRWCGTPHAFHSAGDLCRPQRDRDFDQDSRPRAGTLLGPRWHGMQPSRREAQVSTRNVHWLGKSDNTNQVCPLGTLRGGGNTLKISALLLTHNQGLRQLFMPISWGLCALRDKPDGVKKSSFQNLIGES